MLGLRFCWSLFCFYHCIKQDSSFVVVSFVGALSPWDLFLGGHRLVWGEGVRPVVLTGVHGDFL